MLSEFFHDDRSVSAPVVYLRHITVQKTLRFVRGLRPERKALMNDNMLV
jgi:hypothetical protein